MNIALWIVQSVLAFFFLSGGAYKLFAFDEVAKQLTTLSRTAWGAVGVFEIVGALLLIVPAVTGWNPSLSTLAAVALLVETLALSAVYASHSLELAPTNPLMWSVVMAVLVAFVAYGRHSLAPLA